MCVSHKSYLAGKSIETSSLSNKITAMRSVWFDKLDLVHDINKSAKRVHCYIVTLNQSHTHTQLSRPRITHNDGNYHEIWTKRTKKCLDSIYDRVQVWNYRHRLNANGANGNFLLATMTTVTMKTKHSAIIVMHYHWWTRRNQIKTNQSHRTHQPNALNWKRLIRFTA